MEIEYNNNIVGALEGIRPDMWYLEGQFKTNNSSFADEFDQLSKNLNMKEVYMDLSKVIDVNLIDSKNKSKVKFTVISLENDMLFGRRI